MILLAAGGRALLMQIAHPKVAAGVMQHSQFQKDPFARLHRTMAAMWSIVFDTESQARAALEGIEKVHARVRGDVDRDDRVLLPVLPAVHPGAAGDLDLRDARAGARRCGGARHAEDRA